MIRLLRFQIVGGLGIVVQMTVLYTLTALAGVNFLPATAIAVSLTLLHNFLWHTRWTWADRRAPRQQLGSNTACGDRASGRALSPSLTTVEQFVRFVAANGVVSLSGNVVLMSLLVGALQLAPLPANLLAIALCGGLNFILADRVVFSEGTGVAL